MRTQTAIPAGATGTPAEQAAAAIQRYRANAASHQALVAAGLVRDAYGCGCPVTAVRLDGTGAPRCGADLTPWCSPCLAAHVRACPGCAS